LLWPKSKLFTVPKKVGVKNYIHTQVRYRFILIFTFIQNSFFTLLIVF